MAAIEWGCGVFALLAFIAQTGAMPPIEINRVGELEVNLEPPVASNGEIRYALRITDEDGDGKITPEQLKTFLPLIYPSTDGSIDEIVAIVLILFDTDGNGLLDFDELVKITPEKITPAKIDPTKVMTAVFHMFDSNRDGKLDSQELAEILDHFTGMWSSQFYDGGEVPEELIPKWMKDLTVMDQDGDGEINWEEYSAYIMQS